MTITHDDDVVITGDLEVQGSTGITADALTVTDLIALVTQPILYGNTIINGGLWAQDNGSSPTWWQWIKTDYGPGDADENLELYKAINDADIAPALKFYKQRSHAGFTAPSDGDRIGYIYFVADVDTGATASYGSMEAFADDVSASSEDGRLSFSVQKNGTLTERLALTGQGVGIGTSSPAKLLDVDGTSEHAEMRVSTDKTNGCATLIYGNDAYWWASGIWSDDKYVIRDQSVGVVRATVDSGGRFGLPSLSTEALEIRDAGSASATEQDWVEVTVGGNTGYLRVYASK